MHALHFPDELLYFIKYLFPHIASLIQRSLKRFEIDSIAVLKPMFYSAWHRHQKIYTRQMSVQESIEKFLGDC